MHIVRQRRRFNRSGHAGYGALGRHDGRDLWTDNQRLVKNLAGKLSFTRWVGDFAEESYMEHPPSPCGFLALSAQPVFSRLSRLSAGS